jgi:protein-L-isoaspartate(D-aspartate) O-methyltransferase
MDMHARRRFYAEEIEAVAGLTTPALVEALAAVPRETYLAAGPWMVRGEADLGKPARYTPDADPRHTYHNYSIAIDAARQLFNGAPGVVASAIDALALTRGARVLHVGAGTGYYSAVLTHVVGAAGRVLAIEVDPALAAKAAANLASTPWAEVRCGNATEPLAETFDAMLVSAGVTHPQDGWLDALAIGGRLVLPLTASLQGRMGTLGKGVTALFTRVDDDRFDARVLGLVAIYSAIDLRDDALNTQLGQALMRAPLPGLTHLRRDAHEPGPTCWLHAPRACLSVDSKNLRA